MGRGRNRSLFRRRKQFSSVTPPIVLPSDLSDLAFWYDAQDFASGTSIATWVDKSGNGNTLDQITPALQPAANALVGSKVVAEFTGAQYVYRSTTPTLQLQNNFSVCMFVRAFSATGESTQGIITKSGAYAFLTTDVPTLYSLDYSTFVSHFVTGSFSLVPLILVVTGDVLDAYLDNVLVASGIPLSPLVQTEIFVLGCADIFTPQYFFTGWLAETFAYSRSLNATEIGQMNDYLHYHWF